MQKFDLLRAASPLLAACLAAALPAAANAQSFDGPYAGIEAGVDIVNAEGATIVGPFETTDTDAVIGGLLGVRTELDGGLVIGVEGNLNLVTRNGDLGYGVAGLAGLRLGEAALVYGKAGYGGRSDMRDGLGDGLLLGGGIETRLSERVNGRLGYTYQDLGEIDIPDDIISLESHKIAASLIVGF